MVLILWWHGEHTFVLLGVPNFFFRAVSFAVCFVLQFGYTLFPLWLLGFIGLGRCRCLLWCFQVSDISDNVYISGFTPNTYKKEGNNEDRPR
jgi:hypothetical protein